MSCLIGYIITFISGGLAGAFVNRYFTIRDRRLQKLTLSAVKEEIHSIVPVILNNESYPNLIYKEFILYNGTVQDFDSLDLIIEFDKESKITFEENNSNLGVNKCNVKFTKPCECVYHLSNFNRKQQMVFKFKVAGITKNFFSAVVDAKGVDLEIIPVKAIEKPSLSPSKHVSKTIISK